MSWEVSIKSQVVSNVSSRKIMVSTKYQTVSGKCHVINKFVNASKIGSGK